MKIPLIVLDGDPVGFVTDRRGEYVERTVHVARNDEGELRLCLTPTCDKDGWKHEDTIWLEGQAVYTVRKFPLPSKEHRAKVEAAFRTALEQQEIAHEGRGWSDLGSNHAQ